MFIHVHSAICNSLPSLVPLAPYKSLFHIHVFYKGSIEFTQDDLCDCGFGSIHWHLMGLSMDICLHINVAPPTIPQRPIV